MPAKSIVVIGAGISGLSAGCYGQNSATNTADCRLSILRRCLCYGGRALKGTSGQGRLKEQQVDGPAG